MVENHCSGLVVWKNNSPSAVVRSLIVISTVCNVAGVNPFFHRRITRHRATERTGKTHFITRCVLVDGRISPGRVFVPPQV